MSTEEILIDADNMTLDRLERYLWQRRERAEQGRKSTQDWFLEMLVTVMGSLDDEASQISSQPDDMRQALRLVADKLDQLDKRMAPKEHMPRKMQFAKERVQAVAKYLWSLHPDMSQPTMAAHEAIFNLKITGAKGYTPDTIIKWIAEVDPRAPKKKRGRPRKAKI